VKNKRNASVDFSTYFNVVMGLGVFLTFSISAKLFFDLFSLENVPSHCLENISSKFCIFTANKNISSISSVSACVVVDVRSERNVKRFKSAPKRLELWVVRSNPAWV
jgi:hypothetical protein